MQENELLKAALELQLFCQKRKWKFCFIGGIAVQRWAEPRLTQDADVCLLTGFGNEERFIDELLSFFRSRIEDPKTFALQNRVLLIKASNNIPLDISLAGLPFENFAIETASKFKFTDDIDLITCSAEALLVFKAFAARHKDLADIEGLIVRQMNKINWSSVFYHLKILADLKDEPELLTNLERTKARLVR